MPDLCNRYIRIILFHFLYKSLLSFFRRSRLGVMCDYKDLTTLTDTVAQLTCCCCSGSCIICINHGYNILIIGPGIKCYDRDPILCSKIKLNLTCPWINCCDPDRNRIPCKLLIQNIYLIIYIILCLRRRINKLYFIIPFISQVCINIRYRLLCTFLNSFPVCGRTSSSYNRNRASFLQIQSLHIAICRWL